MIKAIINVYNKDMILLYDLKLNKKAVKKLDLDNDADVIEFAKKYRKLKMKSFKTYARYITVIDNREDISKTREIIINRKDK